jgi:hypothetical protein
MTNDEGRKMKGDEEGDLSRVSLYPILPSSCIFAFSSFLFHHLSFVIHHYKTSAMAAQRASMFSTVMPATLMRPDPTM